MRLPGEGSHALSALRARGIAGDDAFALGSTLVLPVHGTSARDAVAAVDDLGLRPTAVSSRAPTLDDVYLRLTGTRIAA